MLNPFPDLLMFGFFAPTLLRVGVAVVFATVAWKQISRREEIAQLELPIIGKQTWWTWMSAIVHLLLALSLLAGYYTQIAAMMGALLGLKHWFWSTRFPAMFTLGRTGLLVMLICVSLIISGAGALAFDLPL